MLAAKAIENQQLSAISRLFSASLLRELARKGRSPMFVRLVKESSLLNEVGDDDLVKGIFDAAYALLKKKNYRHEYIYKAAIAKKILMGKHSLQTAAMLTEFRACNSKADVVILNGTSTVYEIKSERDSLARLAQQISDYRKVFASVNVITGENHYEEVLNLVPEDVGVLLLTDRFQISQIREAIDVPGRTESKSIFEAIQIEEAKRILRLYGINIPDLPNTMMYGALRDLFCTLSPDKAHDGMVQILRNSRSHMPLEEFLSKLPESIQVSALTTRIRKQDQGRLIEAVNTPLKKALKWK